MLIDEYDHFANELIAFHFDDYQDIVSRNGYVRKFYEVIKTATGEGVVDRIFITGVSPITLDSFTSGFNISRNLTTDLTLHQMMGFTSDEVTELMRKIGIKDEQHYEVLNALINKGEISGTLTSQYSFERNFNTDDFISLLFYLGMLTIKEAQLNRLTFRFPNYVIGELYHEYFADILLRKTELTQRTSSH